MHSGCHASETAILSEHDAEGGFDPNNTPILCVNCHSDNALEFDGEVPVQDCYIKISDPNGSPVIMKQLKNVRTYQIDLSGRATGI